LSDIQNLMETPCVRNCCLNESDICLGCFRSLEEITYWNEASNPERMVILKNALKRQEAQPRVPMS